MEVRALLDVLHIAERLKDELRHASNEMLIARVVGAITTAPALLERLAPKLQAILPPESMAMLAETALSKMQGQASVAPWKKKHSKSCYINFMT